MRFVVCFLGLIAASLVAVVGVGFVLWDAFLGMLIEFAGRDALQSAGISSDINESLTGVTHANTGLVLCSQEGTPSSVRFSSCSAAASREECCC